MGVLSDTLDLTDFIGVLMLIVGDASYLVYLFIFKGGGLFCFGYFGGNYFS